MTSQALGPTWEEVFTTMGRASIGDTAARVPMPAAIGDDLATRFGVALNVLLSHLEHRARVQQSQVEAIERELAINRQQVETIREQHEAILALSTPVLRIDSGLLLLPLVGKLDAERGRRMLEALLDAVRAHRGRVVIIDLTGVLAVDAVASASLVTAARAARLLGARVVLCGITAPAAQEMQAVAAEIGSVRIVSSLQDGVAEARGAARGGRARGAP